MKLHVYKFDNRNWFQVAGRLTPYASEVIFKLSKWQSCLSREVMLSCEYYAHLHSDPFISEPQIPQR